MAKAGSQDNAGQRFTFLDEIGRDGPLRLISAYDSKSQQSVTLDVLEPTTAARRRQILTRAQAAATLRHPDVFAVREVLREHLPPIVVRDHDRLPSLAEHLRSDRAWSPHAAIRLTAKIATVLDRAHARGLVHGRLTPWQIRRAEPKAPYKICGFGRPLSQIDLAAIDLDELRYTAPERLEGASADKSCDLFSLGLILYALLTGRHAFNATDRTLLAAQIAETDPTAVTVLAPALPSVISNIVVRSIMHEPGLRFRNGNEFSEALERALSSVQPSDPPASPIRRSDVSRRLPLHLGTIGTVRALLFGVAIIGMVGTLYAWLRPEPQTVLRPPDEDVLPLSRLSIGETPDDEGRTQPWPIDPAPTETETTNVVSWRTFAMDADREACTRVEALELGNQILLFGVTGNAAIIDRARNQAAEIPTVIDSFWSVIAADAAGCRLLDALATPSTSPRLRLLQLADGRVPATHQTGDLLVLDVDAPLGSDSTAKSARRWHVRVDYWMADGRVAHLVPSDGRSPVIEAGQSLRIGNPAAGEWFRFEPPGGTELAVAILSAQPLTLGDRDRIEAATGYLDDLVQALKNSDAETTASIMAISVNDDDSSYR